jgi:hypothetical protein
VIAAAEASWVVIGTAGWVMFAAACLVLAALREAEQE